MKKSLFVIIALLLSLASARVSHAALPPPIIQWEGVIAALNPTSMAVQSPKGLKVFAIYPGTVFGQRAAKKISDFKVGDKVLVIFSTTGTQTKAENVRNPDDDKKPAPKKGKPAKKK